MHADPSAIWSFSRAPLAWALALLTLNVSAALAEVVTIDPEPWCTDWLWCPGYEAVGVAFNRAPEFHPYVLTAILTPFFAYAAAHIAGAPAGPRRHWFTGPAVLAFIGSIALSFIFGRGLLLFYSVSNSYPPAIAVLLLQMGFVLGTLAACAASGLTLLCTFGWRLARGGLRLRPQ